MVFGTLIVATDSVSDVNLIHAGNVMAQYLDNDEDGIDDTGAGTWLAARGALVLMAGTADDMEEFGDQMWDDLPD